LLLIAGGEVTEPVAPRSAFELGIQPLQGRVGDEHVTFPVFSRAFSVGFPLQTLVDEESTRRSAMRCPVRRHSGNTGTTGQGEGVTRERVITVDRLALSRVRLTAVNSGYFIDATLARSNLRRYSLQTRGQRGGGNWI
jgi:hypothetical protein